MGKRQVAWRPDIYDMAQRRAAAPAEPDIYDRAPRRAAPVEPDIYDRAPRGGAEILDADAAATEPILTETLDDIEPAPAEAAADTAPAAGPAPARRAPQGGDNSGLFGLMAGALLGAGLTLLAAPTSGARLRGQLRAIGARQAEPAGQAAGTVAQIMPNMTSTEPEAPGAGQRNGE
jgi:hypothetical protein